MTVALLNGQIDAAVIDRRYKATAVVWKKMLSKVG